MPIELKEAGKMIEAIQVSRDAMEQSGDMVAAAALNEAIHGLLAAAGELSNPIATEDELSQIQRIAMVSTDLRSRCHARFKLIAKQARIGLIGRKSPATLSKRK